MTLRPFAFIIGLASTLALIGQDGAVHPCGANDLRKLERFHHNDPAELARIEAAEAELEAFTRAFEGAPKGGTAYIIPVVFHIIHNNGPENISDEQVFDAMRVLNDDFNRLNTDWQNVNDAFLGIVANVGVEFRLARKDPQGNCTKGITRTVSTLTNDGSQTMKDLIQWPRNKYLNVWVAASADGAAGYTYRPSAVANWPAGDGIVLLHNYTGCIGTSSPSRSRTLTHEVGHWINLAHTWGNSNEPGLASNCSDDDGVSDTPNTIGWTTCNVNGATCGSPVDNVENSMEYSYCSKMFTEGQKTRMLAALNSGTAQRNQLWTANNLTATGVGIDPVLCAAEFSGTAQTICAGTTETYTDQSFHGVTSRTWDFPGGTPSSSTDAEATVTYTTPGVYQVGLTVSDGTNTLNTTANNYITVLADPGMPAPFTEGFEPMSSFPSEMWTAVNPNGDNTFVPTTAAAYSGNQSVRIINTASMSGRKDELVSSTFDMSDAEDVTISFRYAYARRSAANDDILRFYVSANCGATWSLRKTLRASNTSTNVLVTAPNTTASFVPNGPDQWGYSIIDNVSTSFHSSSFRFKFELESNGGNNVYIDDININGMPVGLAETLSNAGGALVLMPNPATDVAQAIFEATGKDRVSVDLLDVTGRLVREAFQGQLGTGQQRVEIQLGGLQGGIYFVRVVQGGRSEVARLVVR
ncbi:MAG: M43 family zinc metalloprotease [Flavobacteriales bacterium]